MLFGNFIGKAAAEIQPRRIETLPPFYDLPTKEEYDAKPAAAKAIKKRPRDPAQLAKLVVDVATGEIAGRPEHHGNKPKKAWRAERKRLS